MENFDQAMNYDGTLHKVNQALNRLKKIGLNMSRYEELKNEIVNSCEKEVLNSYNYDNGSLGQTAFMEQAYIKAISKLNQLLNNILKYEIYLKAASFTNVLKTFIKSDNKDQSELSSLRTRLVDILNNLANSETLDYQIEGPIINNIYELAYEFIKIEISFLNDSPTLKLINVKDIHVANLDKAIIKDLESMNLNEPKYQEVANLVNEIEAEGFVNYVNLDVLKAIVNSKITLEEKAKILDSLDVKIVEFLNEIDDLNYKLKDDKFNLSFNKSRISTNRTENLKCLGVIMAIVTSFTILGMASFGLAKSLSKDKKYLNKITKYDPILEDPYTISEEYKTNDDDSIHLYEYNPFSKTIFGEFERKIYDYDLSSVGVLTFEEYFNLDLAALGIKGEKQTETKSSLNVEDLYEETIKYIEKVEVNKDDVKIEANNDNFYLFIFLSFFISTIIIVCAEFHFFNDIFVVAQAAKRILDNLAEIHDCKMSRKEYEATIKEYTKKMADLIKDNKKAFEETQKLIPLLQNNPEYQAKISEIEEHLKLVRTKTQDN